MLVLALKPFKLCLKNRWGPYTVLDDVEDKPAQVVNPKPRTLTGVPGGKQSQTSEKETLVVKSRRCV